MIFFIGNVFKILLFKKKNNLQATWKCWDKSPHVQHFTKHPKEYMAALNDHLDGLGLISQPDKMRMRL